MKVLREKRIRTSGRKRKQNRAFYIAKKKLQSAGHLQPTTELVRKYLQERRLPTTNALLNSHDNNSDCVAIDVNNNEDAKCCKSEVIHKTTPQTLEGRDITTLEGNHWLNDQAINAYMGLIQKNSEIISPSRVHVMNSFFYTTLKNQGFNAVKQWTKAVDIFSNLGRDNDECLGIILAYLAQESWDKKKVMLNMGLWNTYNKKQIPRQSNSYDCGVFTCMYAKLLSTGAPINFHETDVPRIRSTMIKELQIGELE
ncbi:sentrin-specific protease 1-like [Hylaeus anthracinus]|uniref:sentrin-specific protease 1-like n=1 Tax=Hylaeus anthracinus TaxID=313031 RepID=UPI0023B8FC60|nr:sentrin-specific protease 1-like [Hylaeus anthracinus]